MLKAVLTCLFVVPSAMAQVFTDSSPVPVAAFLPFNPQASLDVVSFGPPRLRGVFMSGFCCSQLECRPAARERAEWHGPAEAQGKNDEPCQDMPRPKGTQSLPLVASLSEDM